MSKNKVAIITGGTGLIGSHLAGKLANSGYEVYVLTRSPGKTSSQVGSQVYWDPMSGDVDISSLPDAAYVFNLAGAPIVGSRWTDRYKKLIIHSRVSSANTIKQIFEKKQYQPEYYLGASAIGIYGDSGLNPVDETFTGDRNRFIVQSVMAWEQAHKEIAKLGIRTAIIRIGLVVAREGGFIEKILVPAKVGLHGYFGHGSQMQSWIHIDDLVDMMIWGMNQLEFEGTFNGAAPFPVSAKNLSFALRNACGYGLVHSIPRLIIKTTLGEAHKILFDSCNASANKVLQLGFEFQQPKIEGALKDIIR